MGLARVFAVGNVASEPLFRLVGECDTPRLRFAIEITGTHAGSFITDRQEVVCWGRLAEVCNKYLEPGALVSVHGRLRTKSSGEGTDSAFAVEIAAEGVDFLAFRQQDLETSRKPQYNCD